MPDSPEQILAQLQMQLAQAEQTLEQKINIVCQQGQEDYGATFDSMATEVADAVGKDNIRDVMRLIAECDAPTRVIEHLSAHPDRAKKLAAMPPGRRAAEIGRIETQLMPNGSGEGLEPQYIVRAKSGEKRAYSDSMSDAEFERFFKKHGAVEGFLRRR